MSKINMKLGMLLFVALLVCIFATRKEGFSFEYTAIGSVVNKYNGRIVKCESHSQRYLLLDRELRPIISKDALNYLTGRLNHFGKDVKRVDKMEIVIPCYILHQIPMGNSIDVSGRGSMYKVLGEMVHRDEYPYIHGYGVKQD